MATAQAFVDLKDDRTNKLIFHVFAGVNGFGPGEDHADIREKINLEPGRIFNLHVEADCQGNSGTLGTFSCNARADPTFTFDQEAFDAINAAQGLPSFHLADFFEFQFSPNVNVPPEPSPTPEPGTLALLLIGVTLLTKWFARCNASTEGVPVFQQARPRHRRVAGFTR